MRLKITLEIDAQKYGNILPISYQYELITAVDNLLMSDTAAFEDWMSMNRLSLKDHQQARLYTVSNLYIPKIFVEGDRLYINVPRVQFWISTYASIGVEQYLLEKLMGQEIVLGDNMSSVSFHVVAIDNVSPVNYYPVMEYQTLSPLVVVGLRPNKTIEYLNPRNVYFAKFMIDELIERWEVINHEPYNGDRRYQFEIIMPEKRKAVTVLTGTVQQQKVVGYMIKFRLRLAPELQEIAYTLGLGDKIKYGFGYIELLKKEAH